MLETLDLSKILFLDIETVSRWPDYKEMPETFQKLWDEKTRYQRGEESPEEYYPKRAGILAEFGKIICISCGFFAHPREFRVKSFYGDDESALLQEFAELLNKHFNRKDQLLCAHNGKEFDFPYLCRRMVINGIPIPPILDLTGKKPWEVAHLDTMELWGSVPHSTDLRNAA